MERTKDSSGNRGLNQHRERSMTVQRSTTLRGAREKVTNHTGTAEEALSSTMRHHLHHLSAATSGKVTGGSREDQNALQLQLYLEQIRQIHWKD